jgi:hypothetical protein
MAADFGELVTRNEPGRIDQVADRQVVPNEGESQVPPGVQDRHVERDLDEVPRVNARRAFDLIQPEVIGP